MTIKHGDEYSFRFTVDPFNHLVYMGNMDTLNEYMDDKLSEKLGTSDFELTDISYEAKGVTSSGEIEVEASGIIENWRDHEARLEV